MEDNKDYSAESTEVQEVNPLVEEYESKFLNTSTMDKSPVVNNKGITLYASRKKGIIFFVAVVNRGFAKYSELAVFNHSEAIAWLHSKVNR